MYFYFVDCCNKQNHWIIYRTEYEYAREMSFSLSIDSSILLVNEAKKLVFLDFYKYEQNQKKKGKEKYLLQNIKVRYHTKNRHLNS